MRAAGGAGRADAAGVHFGQRGDVVDHTDRVPQLQAERTERPQRLPPAVERVRHLDRVVVADHVVDEDHVAAPRQVRRAQRHRRQRLMLEAAVVPVTVRRHDGRMLAGRGRHVQVAAEEEPGPGLEQHLLDRVAVSLQLAEPLRIERRLLGHRVEAGGGEDLLPDAGAVRFPGLSRGEIGQHHVRVGVRDVDVASVGGRCVHGRARGGRRRRRLGQQSEQQREHDAHCTHEPRGRGKPARICLSPCALVELPRPVAGDAARWYRHRLEGQPDSTPRVSSPPDSILLACL